MKKLNELPVGEYDVNVIQLNNDGSGVLRINGELIQIPEGSEIMAQAIYKINVSVNGLKQGYLLKESK